MKAFARSVLTRASSPESSNLSNPHEWLVEYAGGGLTDAGTRVNKKTALSIGAVFGCCRILAETLASMPKELFEKISPTERRLATDHPDFEIINSMPSRVQTAFSHEESSMFNSALLGNSFSRIRRTNSGLLGAIEFIECGKIQTFQDDNTGELFYRNSETGEIILQDEMLHFHGPGFNGLTGMSVLGHARETFGHSLALKKFNSEFFGKGANFKGVLEHPAVLRSKTAGRISKSFMKSWRNVNHEIPVLEEGMKFQKITIPPNDAQFIETNQFSVEEITRFFRIPLSMINRPAAGDKKDIENEILGFQKFTMLPWIRRFEEEYNRKLYAGTPYFVSYNVNELLRGDFKGMAEAFRLLFQNNAINGNEIRAAFGYNPHPNGDKFFVNGAMVPTDLIDDWVKSKTQVPEPEPEDPEVDEDEDETDEDLDNDNDNLKDND